MRALIVSYAFPPVGGAGVQRVLKLVKYLPEHGIEPAVLTVDNASVPLSDASLEREVPPGVEVVRARTLEPSYALKRVTWTASAGDGGLRRRLAGLARELLIPDPQILWQPAAQLALARRLAARADDVVFVSGPPFSQFLLAPLARAAPNTAVVLDYRDEWRTYRSAYEMSGTLARVTGAVLEPALAPTAHAITTATEAFRAELLARLPALDPERVVTVPNGYDPDDFGEPLPELPTDRFVVTYAGTVFRLTSARALLGAVRLLHERSPALARRLELRFIGRIVETELDAFGDSERLGVTRVDYLPHDRALGELARSHLVLCLLDDVPGAERIYPAKVFEQMRLGRPMLTLAPEGALAELIRSHGAGEIVPARDEAAIARALESRLREQLAGRYVPTASAEGIERFDRRRLAGEFAEVFRAAHARAAHHVTFWLPRANRQSPTTAAALSTTKLRASRAARPARDPSAASP